MKRLEKAGLIGCLDGTGVNSSNYKEFLNGSDWISVKDRLPPKDGTQFIGYSPTNEEAPIYVLVFDPGVKYSGEMERCSRDPSYIEASGECYFTWEPTHWMPLPEPPKG